MTIALESPSLAHASSYRSYILELGGEERYPFPLDFDHSDFAAMLERLADLEAGRNLPPGRVRSSTYWLVDAGELIGVSNLRHELDDAIRRCGGHIGLGVRPSRRGGGVGTRLMALTLAQAWQRGIAEVHIHCYKDNPASARIIQCNGGTLHSETQDGHPARTIQRFLVRAAESQ